MISCSICLISLSIVTLFPSYIYIYVEVGMMDHIVVLFLFLEEPPYSFP